MGQFIRVLNLGAGVQSTTLELMFDFDYRIFADTQEEPEAVYRHLDWLDNRGRDRPKIIRATAGKMGDALLKNENLTGHRFASIPAFTAPHHDSPRSACSFGMIRRQCTRDYKIDVIEQVIRKQILNLNPRQRVPKGTRIDQFFGISWDERKRADRIKKRFDGKSWAVPHFPLIDLRMTRYDCIEWLKPRVPHEVPRSACTFCPFKSSAEWLRLKTEDPNGWARAVQVDNGLRQPGNIRNRKLEQSLYVHRKCIPLEMVDLEKEATKEAARKATPLFELLDCGEGMCGV